jgi:hypothetical protein
MVRKSLLSALQLLIQRHVPKDWQRRPKWASLMSDRAFVFLQRLRDQRSRFLGVVTVKPRPIEGAQVHLEVRGKTVTGRVASITPANWNPQCGVTPTIHVTQDKPS